MIEQSQPGFLLLPPVNTLKNYPNSINYNKTSQPGAAQNAFPSLPEYSIMFFTVSTKDNSPAAGDQSVSYENASAMSIYPQNLNSAGQTCELNPRQYHRILKRREDRARLESKFKIPKIRPRYLHESRHRHAVNRERGNGGRFSSKKKEKNFLTLFDINLFE